MCKSFYLPRIVQTNFWSGFRYLPNGFKKVVSILSPRCWRQQIGWSQPIVLPVEHLVSWHDAINTVEHLVSQHDAIKKVTLSGTHCPAHGVMVRCCGYYANGWMAVQLSPHRLSLFFFAFFLAPLRCYFQGLVLLGQDQVIIRVRLGLWLGQNQGQVSFMLGQDQVSVSFRITIRLAQRQVRVKRIGFGCTFILIFSFTYLH